MGKTKLWVALTVIAGLVTSFLVGKYLKDVKETAVNQIMTTAVVAAIKIPYDTPITKDMLKTITMPANSMPPQAATVPEQIVGQMTIADIQPEEIVTGSKLATGNAATELPYKIPAGYRAVTIGMNAISGVGGHIKPGHHVDVLMLHNKTGNLPDNKVLTVIQDALVLAVGVDLGKKEGVQLAENITLAVTPHEAQEVMITENAAKIKLVLRPAGDKKKNPLKAWDFKALEAAHP